YKSVSDALAGISNSFINIKQGVIDGVLDDVTEEIVNGINKDVITGITQTVTDAVNSNRLVKQDEFTNAITIGGNMAGSEITVANSEGFARSISGVKAGMLTAGSTDAVNGAQLYSMSNMLATYFGGGAHYEDGEWKAPAFDIVQFNSNSRFSKNSYTTVADAFDALNNNMLDMSNRIDLITDQINSGSDGSGSDGSGSGGSGSGGSGSGGSGSGGLGWNENENAYDASHNGQPSKITNVDNGQVANGSQEVVNGGQLWETDQKVTEIGEKVNNLDKHMKYSTNGDGNTVLSLSGGDESEPVLIDNVADGKVEKGSKEAVNGGQLYEQMEIVLNEANKYTDEKFKKIADNNLNAAKQYTDMKFEALSYDIENTRKEARQAAAIGLAVSNLRYDDTPGKLSLAFGSGMWRSQSAFAFGAGYTSESGNIRSNLSVTSTGGHLGVGIGLTFTLN
ncbi:YadA-like family protein, partial [Bartonella sp. CB60]|uniref:YadA-like family protein n=1 Tax=Bartonella sp. CB60 TaxID=3113619 RepID=UPI00300DF7B8